MAQKPFPELLATLRDQLKQDYEALDRALAIFHRHQTGTAKETFDRKLKGATKLLREKHAPARSRREMAPQIPILLAQHGPQSYDSLHTLLKQAGFTVSRSTMIKAVSNLQGRQRLNAKGRGPSRQIWVSTTKPTGANNGHLTGRVFPVTMPAMKSLTFKQRNAMSGFLLHQIAKTAAGPFSFEDVIASLAPHRYQVKGQMLGAAIRYGLIKKAPGSTRKNPQYLLGETRPVGFQE
jgi:hypothetical protein